MPITKVQLWRTSDGEDHATEQAALVHEQKLVIVNMLDGCGPSKEQRFNIAERLLSYRAEVRAFLDSYEAIR